MSFRKSKTNDGFYVETNKNHDVLVLADRIGWKRAKKVKGMIARKLDHDCVVNSIEGPLNAKAGQFVCRGIDTNDWWVQKEDAVNKKYHYKGTWPKPVVFNGIQFTDYSIYMPKPDRAVLCCRMHHEFIVHASWGTLRGKKMIT